MPAGGRALVDSITRLIQELQYFLVLCDELSYTRAAQRLHIGQPALSKHLAQLEEGLHTSLLQRRDRRRVVLTPAGQAFLPRAQRLIAQLRDAQSATLNAAHQEPAQLTVGYLESAAATVLPDAVALLRNSDPPVQLDLRELSTTAQVTGLLSGTLDAGFLRSPLRAPELSLRALWQEPLVACLPADHPLAKRTSVAPADLRDQPTIALETQHPRSEQLDATLTGAGLRATIIQRTDSFATMLHLAAAGIGIAITDASVAASHSSHVTLVPIQQLTTTLYVAWRPDRKTPILDRFLECTDKAATPWQQMFSSKDTTPTLTPEPDLQIN